jgi:hypothetical protein
MNKKFVSGEILPRIKFRYNSKVNVKLSDGSIAYGWIVVVNIVDPEPIYTIEIENGDPNFEALESNISLING